MHPDIFTGIVSRGISRERFDRIRDCYGCVASWAIWDRPDALNKSGIGNLEVLDPDKSPEVLDTVHTDLILIGLNISRDLDECDGDVRLSNFHDKSPKGVDFKLRRAARGTALWGAYMTDIIKRVPITDSNELMKHLKANPRKAEENIASFRRELDEIGAREPTLVPMGGHAADLVRKALGADFRILPIMHYSHYISPEQYCAKVWQTFPRQIAA